MKKKFELGADVERALIEIISINDDLPETYKKAVSERLKNARDVSRS